MYLPLLITLILTTGFLEHKLSANVTNLMDGLRAVAEGDYSVRLKTDKHQLLDDLCEDFNRMTEELQSVRTLREDFVNSYSHEFKTPITAIKGFAELLSEPDLTEEERQQYGANTNVGKATITVTGTGNYTGTVSKEWKITPAVLTISGVTVVDKTYNGSADATVTAVAFNGLKNGEELVIGTDYEVHGAAFNDENVDAANKVTGTVALKNTEKTKNYTLSSATFEQAAAIGRADYTGTASTTVSISLPASLRRKAQKYGAPAWGNAEAEGKFEIGYPCGREKAERSVGIVMLLVWAKRNDRE